MSPVKVDLVNDFQAEAWTEELDAWWTFVLEGAPEYGYPEGLDAWAVDLLHTRAHLKTAIEDALALIPPDRKGQTIAERLVRQRLVRALAEMSVNDPNRKEVPSQT